MNTPQKTGTGTGKPPRPRPQKLNIASAHKAIARRYPKVLAELAK